MSRQMWNSDAMRSPSATRRSLRLVFALWGAFALCGCVSTEGIHIDPQRDLAERSGEVATLLEWPTASRIAIAAWLSLPWAGHASIGQPFDLIARAEALAPEQPEIVLIHVGMCIRMNCPEEEALWERLMAVDPDNGSWWMWDLARARKSGSDAAVTDMVLKISASAKISTYWNELTAMAFDALESTGPSNGSRPSDHDRARRVAQAYGIAAAIPTPPLQPVGKSCQRDQLEIDNRRAACVALLALMGRGNTLLEQGLALNIQLRWWPDGSPERDDLRARRRRFDYLRTTAEQFHWWREDRDMIMLIDAARRMPREEDVLLELLRSHGLPLVPPTNWVDPFEARN